MSHRSRASCSNLPRTRRSIGTGCAKTDQLAMVRVRMGIGACYGRIGNAALHSRLYKPSRHGHMLSHACMEPSRANMPSHAKLLPWRPGLHGTMRNHLKGCLSAWPRARACSRWAWAHMSPCLHGSPLAGRVFPWPPRPMHSRSKAGAHV